MPSPLVILVAVLVGSVVGYALRIKQVGFKWEELAGEASFLALAVAVFLYFTRKDMSFCLPLALEGVALVAHFNLKKHAFDLKGSLLSVSGMLAAYFLGFHFRHNPLEKVFFVLWLPFGVAYVIVWLKSLGGAASETESGPIASVTPSRPPPARRSGRGPKRGGGRK